MKIHPGKSVGPLVLGMSQEAYESILGLPDEEFKRTSDSTDVVLEYRSKCFHLGIDDTRRITSISVFRPEKVEFEGIQLLGRPLEDVEAELSKTPFEFSEVDAGLECEEAGIVIVEYEGVVDGVEVTALSIGSEES